MLKDGAFYEIQWIHEFFSVGCEGVPWPGSLIIPRIQIQRQDETDREEISNDDEGKDEGFEEET